LLVENLGERNVFANRSDRDERLLADLGVRDEHDVAGPDSPPRNMVNDQDSGNAQTVSETRRSFYKPVVAPR
jgi:hypothetical protein